MSKSDCVLMKSYTNKQEPHCGHRESICQRLGAFYGVSSVVIFISAVFLTLASLEVFIFCGFFNKLYLPTKKGGKAIQKSTMHHRIFSKGLGSVQQPRCTTRKLRYRQDMVSA